VSQPNKEQLLRWVYTQPNRSIQFIGNVIHCHMSNKHKKLLGMWNLVQAGKDVGTGNTIDQVSIDGRIQPIGALESHA